MLNSIYILQKTVDELQHLIGCKIVDCYSNNFGVLHLDIYDGKDIFCLNVSLLTDFEAIFLTKLKNKPKKNILRQFQQILGEVIQNIEIIPNNRIIKIELIKKIVYVHIFGKSQNNAIITDKNDAILDSYRNRNELVGNKYSFVKPKLLEITEFPSNTKLLRAVSGSKFLFGKHLGNELLNRLKLDGNLLVSQFPFELINKLVEESQKLYDEIQNSNNYYILQNADHKTILSPIKLIDYPIEIEQSSDLFNLIRKVFSQRINQYRFEKLKGTLASIDEKYLKKYESKVRRFSEIPHLKKIIKEYQKYTELLFTLPEIKQKGFDKIELKDYEGNSVVVPLDSKLSIIQNIEKYYSKIKKINRDIQIIEKNHNSIVDEYNLHNQRYQKLLNLKNYIELKKFYKDNQNFYRKSMQNIPKEISEKFKKFELADNATLYVGKDSKNNDELTFGFGKANDYWFHLRGGSGSHCILKYSGEGKPPKAILEKAASLAAYYSSQRNGGFVPVIYTQRKYVRKPKGANTGSVIVAKEEIVMVEPKSYEQIINK